MKEKMKIAVAIFCSCLLICGLYNTVGSKLSAGSYENVERFELDGSESEVIAAIQNLKADDKTLEPPTTLNLKDGKREKDSYWYRVYFLLKDHGMILFTWVRVASREKTTFALVAVSPNVDLHNWQEVNMDLPAGENKRIIKLVEKKIVERIRFQLAKQSGKSVAQK